ncbi:MAG: NADH-quinone oxidoreductase subunit C [Acidimicrobiales bacterium]
MAAPPAAGDAEREAVVGALRARLAGALLAGVVASGDLWVRVDRTAWKAAVEVCRKELGFDYFGFLSAIDWMPSEDLTTRHERIFDPEPDAATAAEPAGPGGWATGVAGGDTRFQVFARLYNTTTRMGITLKADLDSEQPAVESIVTVYRGADWHEREAWEMFGIDFTGHPGLRHLYLPGEFEGFPMRKDFPLLSREVKPWPGLVDKEPIPGEGDEASGEEAEE